uniref:Uncharacterized protein n=1 Tax=Oryza brachyantha TaxID=4533 RepID=J3M8E1_ORYBR
GRSPPPCRPRSPCPPARPHSYASLLRQSTKPRCIHLPPAPNRSSSKRNQRARARGSALLNPASQNATAAPPRGSRHR